MDLFKLAVYVVGAFFLYYFFRYTFVLTEIFNSTFKTPDIEVVDQSDFPLHIRKLYELKSAEIVALGFKYLYSTKSDGGASTDFSFGQSSIFYHKEAKTFASISELNFLDRIMPFKIIFYTTLKSNTEICTLNGFGYTILGKILDAESEDTDAATLKGQFEYHKNRISTIDENKISICADVIDPKQVRVKIIDSYEGYYKALLQSGYVRKSDNNEYVIKILPGIRYAHQLIRGSKKLMNLRNHMARELEPYPIPIEVEIEKYKSTISPSTSSGNLAGKIFIFLSSVILFFIGFSIILPFNFVMIIFILILLHESGHLLSMKMLGYRNLSMLFIPLFGAVAMGSDRDVLPYKKIISYFAGPAPGIIIIIFGYFGCRFFLDIDLIEIKSLRTFLIVGLVINYFNLLPFLPLDGGQIFNIIIFARFPILHLIFGIVSFAGMILLGYFLKTWVTIIIAIFLLIRIKQIYYNSKIIAHIKEKHGKFLNNEKEILESIFTYMQNQPFNKYSWNKRITIIQNIESVLYAKHPTIITTLLALLFYTLLIAPGVLAIYSYLSKGKIL